MENSILQYTLYILITIVLAIPLGAYIGSVMLPEGNVVTRWMRPIETGMYRMIGVDASSEMNWKQYAMAIGWVSLVSFLVLWILLMVQGALPLNPQHVASMSWDLAANTAISYITNTNWQSYAGEAQLSYLSQMLGLTVQNFISAGVGISVLFALLRGFVRATQETIGNFWSDFVRILLYVLLPLSMLISLLLVSQGVVQNLNAYQTGSLLESQVLEDGTRIEEQILFQGP
ncbi:MAG: potassium-transporting ATPase subunit KdpA, partial [Erysipelotrichaceae bacterium]